MRPEPVGAPEGGASAPGRAVGAPARHWRERYLDWRNGLLADPDFHRRARRNPFLRLVARRRARAMFDLCAGFVYSQVLAACVELRLFEALADGPRPDGELARAVGLDEAAADALLRSAAPLGLVERRPGGWGLGIHGAAFLANPGVRTMVEHHALLYRDLAEPAALLRGEAGETRIGAYWDYARARAEPFSPDPEGSGTAPYTRLMAASQAMIAEQVLEAYPLARHRRLLDVGGGDGTFLRTVARAAPGLELVLFDLPPVAAAARERFAAAPDGAGGGAFPSVECVGGDAFDAPLPSGADVVSLVRVVHDHDDDRALALLVRCREGLGAGGTLLVAEPMAREAGGDRATDAYFGMYLRAMGRGRPRTPAELRELIARAGFARVSEVRTPMPMLASLLVARVE